MGYCGIDANDSSSNGFRFLVYSHDHEPPHVHAFKGGTEAKLGLGDETTAPFVIDPKGMAIADVRRAVRIVEAHQSALLEAWRKYHE